MSIYKGITIPDKLSGLIGHMEDLEQSREEISILGQQWDLLTILGQMTGSGTSMAGTRASFHKLTEQLLGTLGLETLKKTTQSLTGQAQVSVDIVIRNLFERTADIGFLATDEDIREYLVSNENGSPQPADSLRERFAEYVAKYSVYNNIVLLSPQGKVMCSLREDLELNESKDSVILEAQKTTAAFVEFFRKTDINPFEDQSLIYAYRVTENNDPSSRVIGVLCLVFKFRDELEMVFKNLSKEDDWNVITLLDSTGRVIASSDEAQIPLNSSVPFNADKEFQVTKFGGRLYLSKTCATKGYQGYKGLGWFGHAMVPLEYAFASKDSNTELSLDDALIQAVTHNENLFSKSLAQIPLDAKRIQSDLDRTVWNGNVREDADSSDTASSSRKVLLWEISTTGNKTRGIFDKSIDRLNRTAASSIFTDASFVSALSVDIMDRNLYERANDCRWWALTTAFRNALSQENRSPEEMKKCSEILRYINGLYTVYTNLFLYDQTGKILAVSNRSDERLIGKTLQDDYIRKSLSEPSSQAYSVSPFKTTDLYGNRPTYVYASSITCPENHSKVVGGIGIVFDSEPQFKAMLEDSLPRTSDGAILEDHYALFVDKEEVVIASTHPDYKVGSIYKASSEFLQLQSGQSKSQAKLIDKNYIAFGVSCTKGYREFKGPTDPYKNPVLGIVLTKLGEKPADAVLNHKQNELRVDYGQRAANTPTKEFATFYIGNIWMGFEKKHVVECVDLGNPTPMPGVPKEVVGTILYNNQPISVINASKHICEQELKNLNEVIVIRTEQGLLGVLISRLGEIPEVPDSFIVKGSALGQVRNEAIEYLVRPAPTDPESRMLVIMNPDRFFTSTLSGVSIKGLVKAAQTKGQNIDPVTESAPLLRAVGDGFSDS